VKIGQVFALRPDFLDDQRCRVLGRLYSNTTSLPPEDSLALIASYAGSTYLENFASFNPQPFASASIGQVHRAVLKTGEQVAVKIVKKEYAKKLPPRRRQCAQAFPIAPSSFTPGSAAWPTPSACSGRLRR